MTPEQPTLLKQCIEAVGYALIIISVFEKQFKKKGEW